jgi:hypothetical protein
MVDYIYVSALLGSYLIVITERESVGSYLGHPIFKVSSLKIFPCNRSLENSPEEQVSCCFTVCLSYLDGISFKLGNCYVNFGRKRWRTSFLGC